MSALLLVGVLLGAAQSAGPRQQFSDRPQQREDWFLRLRRSRDDLAPAAHRFAAFQRGLSLPTLHRRALAGASGAAAAEIGGDWTELGPRPEADATYGNLAGRFTALALDGGTLYAGAADGGLWVSQNPTGPNPLFTPIGDNLPSLSIGAIALDPSTSPTTIYVGTGEPNGSGDSYYGMGILKSTDAGATWTLGGGNVDFTGSAISKLLVDAVNPQILLAAVTESGTYAAADAVQSVPAIGIVRSTDGGATWKQVFYQNASGLDLVYDPAAKEYFAAIRGMGIYASNDQGASWSVRHTTVGQATLENFYRVALAERDGTLYELIADGYGLPAGASDCDQCTGLSASSDGGIVWTDLSLPATIYGANQQGDYDLFLAAPAGTNQLVAGGIDVWSGAAGSAAWTNLTNSYTTGSVHPDEHAIVAVDSTHWYIANDGGLWYTSSAGASWQNLNATLGAIQFYSVSADPATAGRYWGGSQDNGTALAGAGSQRWVSEWGGDGGHTAINPANRQQLFTENAYISLQRSDDGGTTFHQVVTGDRITDPSEFYVPYVLAPGNSGNIYLAAARVWRGPASPSTPNQGWQAISAQLTNPNYSQGPLDALTAIAVAPSSEDVVYVGAYDGTLSGTQNATYSAGFPTWTTLYNPGGGPVTAIAVSPSDPKTVYWGIGNIGPTSRLYKSTDGGHTNTDIAGNLPGTPINAIVLDPSNPNAIYVATDVGVFAAGDGGAGAASGPTNGPLNPAAGERWARIGDNLPAAAVLSLTLTDAGGTPTLVAGTHGRGAWSLPAILPPSFTMAVTPATVTVEAKQPAAFSVQTTAVGGASTIALSCQGYQQTFPAACAITPTEIGAGQSATVAVTPQFAGTNSLAIIGDTGFAEQSAPITVQVLDFFSAWGGINNGFAAPTQVVEAGASATLALHLGSSTQTAFDAPVALSCPNAPAGVTCSFSPATITDLSGDTPVSLAVQVATSATPGAAAMTVRATGGAVTHDLTLNLEINRFGLAVAPSVQTVTAGTPAVFTVSATSASAFTGNIALSCGLQYQNNETGNCALQPASIQAGQSSVVTITGANSGLAVPFEITGTAGASTAMVPVTVQSADYSVSLNNFPVLTTIPGSSGFTRDLTVFRSFGYSTPVQLSCSSAAGVTCSFNPATLTPVNNTSTVTIGGMSGLAPSSAIPLTIVGTSGGLQRTEAISLRNDGGFTLQMFSTLSPTPTVILPGDPVQFGVAADASNGYAGSIALACASGLNFACTMQNFTVKTGALTGTAGSVVDVPVVGTTSDGGATLTATVDAKFTLGDFSFRTAAPTVSVAGGQTTTLALNFSETAGLNLAVTMACSGLPAGASCSGTEAQFISDSESFLEIQTSAVQGSLPPLGGRPKPGPTPAPWAWSASFLAAAGLLFGIFRRRRLALVGVLVLASIACGGGSGGSGGGGGGSFAPPPITSAVTITATDATPGVVNPVSRTATFTLTIH